MDEVRVDEKKAVDEGKSALHPKGAQFEGNVRISDDVIIELTKKTLLGIPYIQLASTSLVSKFGIGRKGGEGVRVSSVEDGKIPATTVDVYIRTKFGHRIPDLVWDVQEKVKANVERYTGYTVTAVNVNVQGIFVDDPKEVSEEAPEEEDSGCAAKPAEEE